MRDAWRHRRCQRCRKPLSVDFALVSRVALSALPELVLRWLPNGRHQGCEWVALNPTRHDRHLGSFSINLHTGAWADFATGDRGGDVVSLAGYLFGLTPVGAGRELSVMLGIEVCDGH
jgi:hypothetical protein